ncbi:MAG: DNA primase [Candidatus Pacebacteria bacterium]|nr:DNA primase [Candidatus Paceibacterota bacterium]
MPSSTTELIKSKLDVVEVLRGYLTLQPAGKNFKALCPFHGEKSPSFIVSPDRQTWHCFGCGLGGDIFSFVMKYENLEFGDALRLLAEKAGVELRHENPAEYRLTGLLYDLNEASKNFFRKALAAAPVAKEYLKARGLTQETIDEFELGWAPNEMEALSMTLLHGGAAPQDLIQAGLSVKTERGMMLDRFRGRIMFPIHNHLGKVVGFTGRILPQLDTSKNPAAAGSGGFVTAKYVNSPETPIFQKSKLLYGFWKSKEGIRESKAAFLVEGQMDYLMSWQSGVRNVIASSGTALTADHLRSVHRLADEIILSFDNDTAGSDAAERAIDLAEAVDFTVKVALIEVPGAPAGSVKDAADAVNADPESVKRAIAHAMPAPEFYFKKYLPPVAKGVDPAEQLRSRDGLQKLRLVIGKLHRIASPVARESWMKELSKRTNIPERTLEEEATRNDVQQSSSQPSRTQEQEQAQGEVPKRQLSRQERLCEDLLAIAVAKGDFSFLDDSVAFFTPVQKEIFDILKTGARRSDDPTLDAAIDLIVLRDLGDLSDLSVDDMATLKSGFAWEYYKERRHILTLAVKNAEARGDEAELAAALAELRNLPGEGTE